MKKYVRIFAIILGLYCIFNLSYMVYEDYENATIKKQVEESFSVVEESSEETKYDVDFSKLKSENSSVVAWIYLNDTKISYPVVQYSDNSYYLKHNYRKEENNAGWIFMDYRNSLDDKNVVIYGHGRIDGSMFGTLKNLFDESYYLKDDNLDIKLITEEKTIKYRIFSVYKIKFESYYNQVDFEENDFKKFLKTIQNRSIFKLNQKVFSDDNIITLSTCADGLNNRLVVHAVKIN